ncbi:cyclic peptide export ABC transporter [Xanthomonas prunicola]|uniref:Cyclic peptide export ABC transporter n=1 Tax=Xanthomonas prunicola TaxID=2053930 RepID=A0A9Q9J2U6_9XANT|nr:cyclic peptide export ABC transporter [Xanthomonas prunicola]USJ00455.1 cyclic peptide export ABC transporter [Xanthomonas prunicola]UXA49009.1 cyclic peptide export ABC transporter [Xanthomonas prunicola]UXA57311.1 cyclic peptide export ABC transporter [Xanthomonas prunicola]UXA63265.1 cyclic peptide export ABC transporter [Xanthomonas prunicola]UXA65483.1 cyclic peptide export ABC transporter [Xanthomonas prunicola]
MLIQRYLRRHARILAGMSLLSAASAGTSMLLLDYLNSTATDALQIDTREALLRGALLLVAALVVRLLSARLAARVSSGLMADLRTELSARFLELPLERLMHRKHAVFGALIGDVGRLAQMIQMGPVLLTNSLLSLGGLLYLAWVSLPLFAVVVPFIGLSGALFYVTRRFTGPAYDRMRKAEETLNGLLRTLVEGKKELTLSPTRANHFARAELCPAIERARSTQFDTSMHWGISDACAELIGYGWVLAAILAGRYLFDLPSATILQFVITGLFISGPLNALFDLGAQVGSASASVRHLREMGLDDAPSAPSSAAAATDEMPAWTTLRLEQVIYRYAGDNGDHFQFGPVDFTLRRGETVFVTGGNGSGKSTLLLLLSGLLRPSEGRILLDGQALETSLTLASYRAMFSAVFFDFMLFSHVIGSDAAPADPAQVQDWLERVDLAAKVAFDQADGVFASVNLSQGQRKRLALVQACLDDRQIMLFDEFTADQDQAFRERFYTVLLPELRARGKTLVLVTHDAGYRHLADRVLSLDYGHVVEPAPARNAPLPADERGLALEKLQVPGMSSGA